MALLKAHKDVIDVAFIDALHAFSNETDKAEADHNSDTERSYQGLPTPSIGAPVDSAQTREAVDLDVPPQQITNGMVDVRDPCLEPRYIGHNHLSLIDTRSTSEINSGKVRPAYRYATLIAMAILQAKDRCLKLAEIYQWISNHFPYYSLAKSGWQNNVRHNLSVNENFIKIERPSHDPGRGHYWGIKPGQEHWFIQGIDVSRSAKTNGDLQRRRDWINRPSVKAEQLAARKTPDSVRGLCLHRTIEEQPQQVKAPSRIHTETSGPVPEHELRHPSAIPATLTPLPSSQTRREIGPSSLPRVAQMDHIEKESRLEANRDTDICDYTPSADQPVTHVYLPHLMRDTGLECQKFEAHRAESEIARIRKSSTNRS